MVKALGWAAAAALLGGLTTGAGAMPIAPAAGMSGGHGGVTLVRDGCGPYGYRTPYGNCKIASQLPYRYGLPRSFSYDPQPEYDGHYGRRCFIRDTPDGPRRICR